MRTTSILKLIGATVVLSLSAQGSANAGGFSHRGHSGTYHYVQSHAKATSQVKAKTKYFTYMSGNKASTSSVLFGKWFVEGNAKTSQWSKFKAKGKVKYYETNDAKSKVYAKAGNIMAKARSRHKVRIVVQGKVLFVSESELMAMTRFTPLGTTAHAQANTSTFIAGQGKVSYASSTKTDARIRVKR